MRRHVGYFSDRLIADWNFRYLQIIFTILKISTLPNALNQPSYIQEHHSLGLQRYKINFENWALFFWIIMSITMSVCNNLLLKCTTVSSSALMEKI